MAMELRYMGEFLSREGVTWRVELRQEAPAPFAEIGTLTFEANQALTIEWTEKKKEEVICGSVATIQIESPGDRTYEELYTIEVGQIRMDVYRNGALYWSGMLDPEFYEEPYERAANYEVSLSFSDFGILQRKKYALAGMLTVKDVLDMCLREAGIIHTGIDQSLISTSLYGADPLTLSDIKVRSDNFYDEDGEASTLEDVLIGILQPLGLRMVQRCGKIYIYDLNGLYINAKSTEAVWSGDSSTMGVDVVYNNAKITWSTYAQSGNLAPTECWGGIETDATLTALNSTSGKNKDGAKYFSYHYSTKLSDWIDATDCGFTIWTATDGVNAELLNEKVRFFKIVPQYDGTEGEGIAIYWKSVQGVKKGSSSNWTASFASEPHGESTIPGEIDSIGASLFKSSPVWIPPVDSAGDLVLRVAIDMLLDPRFNPFETAANLTQGVEQKLWYDLINKYGNFVYVPVLIKFQPDGSDTVYVWTNQSIVKQAVSSPVTTLNATYGNWVVYSGDRRPNAWGYLCYYDAGDRKDTSGVLGWRKNRPAINPHKQDTISVLTNAKDGQYIPYPNYGGGGGKLWVEVCGDGWNIVDGGTDLEKRKRPRTVTATKSVEYTAVANNKLGFNEAAGSGNNE